MNALRTGFIVSAVAGLLLGPGWVGYTAELDVERGLVLYYPFETGADEIVDESGENNHAQLEGALLTDEGRFGKALQFATHDDSATIPNSPSLEVTTGFTLNFWVYPIEFNFAGNGEHRMLYRDGQYNIDLLLAQGRLEIRSGPVWHQVAMGPQVQTEEWQMVTGTWSEEDGEGRLYRDGLVVKKNISIPSIEPGTGKVTKLGATHGVGRGWPTYVGRIDEVRIWNRALSEDEVEALFIFEPPQAIAPQGKLAAMWGRVKYDR